MTEGTTAFDRLEADKAKYVKTPKVREQRQNPAIDPTFSPTLLRKSLSSFYRQNTEDKHTYSNSPSRKIQPRTLQRHDECRQSKESSCTSNSITLMSTNTLLYETMNTLKTNHVSSIAGSPSMFKKSQTCERQTNKTTSAHYICSIDQKLDESCHGNEAASPNSPVVHPFSLRRASGKRVHRPDSLIIYRQRRDFIQTEKENNEGGGGGLVIRLLQNTPLLKRRFPLAQTSTQVCSKERPLSPMTQRKTEKSFVCQAPHLSPSEEKISREKFSLQPSELQHFFDSCGLEGSLLDLLDSVCQVGSITATGSLESVDRVSGRSVVIHEEVKEEKTPLSIIERNARVIKWIYNCQHARAVNAHRVKPNYRESTV
ncbi:hypothetical protein GDO86_003500 [Hymenochirus boettgeri]|uniref:Family with sequence similarity 110 member D n=1 Tax=Hymenochirus boettgeri TaxID=247094 RepID=A0A8T2K1R1_9PIPI|nr:hypothetical protein GDO86_003500 [Hymenochirus boettgeri]